MGGNTPRSGHFFFLKEVEHVIGPFHTNKDVMSITLIPGLFDLTTNRNHSPSRPEVRVKTDESLGYNKGAMVTVDL